MDPYKILGIKSNANLNEIKSAYRKLAKENHPDNGGNKEIFQQINEAYNMLLNRKNNNLETIFNDILNNNNFAKRRNGDNVHYDLRITFEEAINGCKKNIDINIQKSCIICNGTGSKSINSKKTCPICYGTGMIGLKSTSKHKCTLCNGKGYIIKDKCNNCYGKGIIDEFRTIQINIPQGVDTGDTIKIPEMGSYGLNGGKNGDLIVDITVYENNKYKRNKLDVTSEIEIDSIDAMLGTTKQIKSIYNEIITINIPAGIQYGKCVVVNNIGIKKGNIRGNHKFIVKIKTLKLTDEQKNFLKNFKGK